MKLDPSKTQRRYLALLPLIFIGIAIAVIVPGRLVYGDDQDVKKLNQFVQTSKSAAAMAIFTQGRDFIEAENWPEAAKKFSDFINGYPKDRDVDAALYWYAYALQKQSKKEEAIVPLRRLVKEFPNSSWRREADAMLVVLGQRAVSPADAENCEIKILALQSLFDGDEDRAIGFVSDVLKSNQTNCPSLKYAAVSLLGSHGGPRVVPMLLDIARNQSDVRLRLTAIKRLGEQSGDNIPDELAKIYDADNSKEVRTQILRAFSELPSTRGESKLLDIARGSSDIELRQYAIRFLGERHEESSLNALISLFDSDRTPQIRYQILRALSERNDARARAKLLDVARKGETPELRVEAIRRLGEQGNEVLEDLLQLYSTETDIRIKEVLLRAFGEIDDPRAYNRLFQIAKSNDALELRASAIRGLAEHNREETTAQLVSLYDSETNPQVKEMLIRVFAESQQKAGVRKLISIARSDANVEFRKLAIRRLGESRDPEALKFLEELLK